MSTASTTRGSPSTAAAGCEDGTGLSTKNRLSGLSAQPVGGINPIDLIYHEKQVKGWFLGAWVKSGGMLAMLGSILATVPEPPPGAPPSFAVRLVPVGLAFTHREKFRSDLCMQVRDAQRNSARAIRRRAR